VKTDDRDLATDFQLLDSGFEAFLKCGQLIIYRYSQRLKGPSRRVRIRRPSLPRNRCLYNLGQVPRCENGLPFPAFINELSNPGCPSLLPPLTQNPLNSGAIQPSEQFARRHTRGRIHPHIEWGVDSERKAALTRVQLVRRDSQIEQDAIHGADSV
jgi:hypothetical protein